MFTADTGNTKAMIDQRRYARFPAESDTFASVGYKQNIVGRVIDMSLGGLSFEYLVGEKIITMHAKLDIFSSGNIFHLYNLPCHIVYDINVNKPHVNNSLGKVLTTRRAGLKYAQLHKNDFLQLKLFIENISKSFSG